MLILATKLKNALPAHYAVTLRNVSVNGKKIGCTGFVQYAGRTVYINTERGCGFQYMARTAAHSKDYTGGRNHFADNLELLVALVNTLIVTTHIPT